MRLKRGLPIRSMQMADLPFVLPLLRDWIAQRPVAYPAFPPDAWADAERMLLRALVTPGLGLHVAVTKLASPRAKACALTLLEPRLLGTPAHVARVLLIAVDPAFAHLPLAARLLEAAHAWAVTQAGADVALEVSVPAGAPLPPGAMAYEVRAVVANAGGGVADREGDGHDRGLDGADGGLRDAALSRHAG